MIDGLTVAGSMDIAGKCEDCILRKQVACVYDEDVTPEDGVLKHVHIDMWGPASVKSVGGALYLMVIVDGGSAMKFSYPLSHKTTELTLQVFMEFHVAGRKLQNVRLDLS